MRTSYTSEEPKDNGASNFWSNLAGKLGIKQTLVKKAAGERPGMHLKDGIVTHSTTTRKNEISVGREALNRITKTLDARTEARRAAAVFANIITAQTSLLGEKERVDVASKLTGVLDRMSAVRDRIGGAGDEDPNCRDLSNQIGTVADAVAGAAAQLREKVQSMNQAQAEAVERASVMVSEVATVLDGMKAEPGMPLMADPMAMEAPMIDMAPAAPMGLPGGPSPIAGHTPAMKKKAAAQCYDDLRCVHIKLSLVQAVLDEMVATLGVGDLGLSPMGPQMGPIPEIPGMMEPGMGPQKGPMEPGMGPQKGPMEPGMGSPEGPIPMASLRGTLDKFADGAEGNGGGFHPDLPEYCFANLPSTNEVIKIVRGEDGYYQIETDKTADELNAEVGVDAATAEAMLAGSMFGWNVPGARPETYRGQEKGKKAAKTAASGKGFTVEETADGRWMVLFDGVQAGKGPRDMAGASPQTWATREEAESAGLEMGKYAASVRTAASGDPGDTEPGNLVYKDINKCRDCVWFESDFTHETYRDKCKHCIHAKLEGTTEHFWPKSQQMVVFCPEWSAPEAAERKGFEGSLSILDVKTAAETPASQIAEEIVSHSGGDAVSLGTEFTKLFTDPTFSHLLASLGRDVARQVEAKTGIGFFLTSAQAKAWGYKGNLADGGIAIACDMKKVTAQDILTDEEMAAREKELLETERVGEEEPTGSHMRIVNEPHLMLKKPFNYDPINKPKDVRTSSLDQRAKGERQKIRSLRERLEKSDDPSEIKSLSDAIDSLENRIDKDQKAKEDRRQKREEKQKEQAEAPAEKEPVTAKKMWPGWEFTEGDVVMIVSGPREGDTGTVIEEMGPVDAQELTVEFEGGERGHYSMTQVRKADAFHGSLCLAQARGSLRRAEIEGEDQPGVLKNYKVVAVSSNTNSFGLYGVVLMAQDGDAWEVAYNQLEPLEKGDVINVKVAGGEPDWNEMGMRTGRTFEIPRKLAAAPKNVIAQVWGDEEERELKRYSGSLCLAQARGSL